MSPRPSQLNHHPAGLRSGALLVALIAGLLTFPPLLQVYGQANPISVQAAVESQDVFVREAFVLQILVRGVTQVSQPDLSHIKTFTVTFQGAYPDTSTQVTVVNGRMTRQTSRQVDLRYQLTPTQTGNLVIPAISVNVGSKTYKTNPIPMRVTSAGKFTDACFILDVSRQECYVGEPLNLKFALYMDQRTRSVEFSLPLLDHPGFDFPKTDVPVDPNQQRNYRKIALSPKREVIGLLGNRTRNGKSYTTLAFELVIIPRTPGEFSLPQSTATCQVAVGYSNSNRDFFNQRRERLRSVVVPADELELKVSALPTQGRPARFSGCVGIFQVATRAEPTVVNVGDPVALQVFVSGPTYLDFVTCPPFDQQPDFSRDFRVSADEDPGEMQGRVKVFKRIIRAANPNVNQIPPVELSYFDTRAGAYATVTSKPIPITVKATKMVTALDAEGTAPVTPAAKALKAWSKGIAHNYEDPSVISNQQTGLETWLASPLWLGLLVLPPLGWTLLFASLTTLRRRQANPAALAARRAGSKCLATFKTLATRNPATHDQLLDALRQYFGAKLQLPGGALTFADLEPRLKQADLDDATLVSLQTVFAACTANRYAGGVEAIPVAQLAETATGLVKTMEKVL